jgi:hypothetical protein
LKDDGSLYLNEMIRRATMTMLRLTWLNTAVALVALVIALVALFK